MHEENNLERDNHIIILEENIHQEVMERTSLSVTDTMELARAYAKIIQNKKRSITCFKNLRDETLEYLEMVEKELSELKKENAERIQENLVLEKEIYELKNEIDDCKKENKNLNKENASLKGFLYSL